MADASKLHSNHHTFLQAVMKRGPLSEKAATGIYKSLVLSTGEGFVQFLLALNKELEYVQLELKKVMNQYDGKEFYGVINTLPSKEAKLGTHFTQGQILFFKAVMEAIVQEPTASGVITSTSAMWLKLEPPRGDSEDASTQTGPIKMSMQSKEEALALLVAEQLLSRTEDGGVALGVKAFLELRSVFRNLEVPFCQICNEAAIKAQLCSTRDCLKRVHVYCLARSRNQRPKCPGCKTVWVQPLEEQERPANEDDEYTEAIATQDPAQTSKTPRMSGMKRSATLSDDGEEEHLEANGHHADKQISKKARMSGRKRSAALSDDAEEEHLEANGHHADELISKTARMSGRKRSAALSDDAEEEDLEANGHDTDEDQIKSLRSTRSSSKFRKLH